MNKFLLQKAIDFHQKNQFKKALKLYLDIYECDANNYELIFLIGTIYLQISDYTQAILFFEKIQEDYKNIYHVYSNLGVAYMENKEFMKAKENFLKSIQINKNYPHSFNNLGNLYAQLKDYHNAILNYTNAINLENNSEFYFNRAKSYFHLNLYFEAESDLKNIENNFKTIDFYIFKINLYLVNDEHQKIINFINNIDLNFKNNETIKALEITSLLELGITEGILSLIENLKKLNTKYFLRGLFHYKNNNFEHAINEFTKLIDDSIYSYKALNNLGLIEKDIGNYDKSLDYLKQALLINPELKDSKTNIGIINLIQMNFVVGWNYYYYRKKNLPKAIYWNLPEYKNLSLPSKKTLIISEQGIGDQIFYLQLLKANLPYAYDFIIDQRLIPQYSTCYNNNNFYSFDELPSIDFKNYDSYIFLADIFKFFISSNKSTSIFKKFPIIKNTKLIRKSKLTIGISWRSFSNKFATDHSSITKNMKSISLNNLISEIKKHHFDFNLVNLQYGNIDNEISNLSAEDKSLFISHEIDLKNDFKSVFMLTNQCDYVISIGNALAHIAGTLDKKTFILIPEYAPRIWYWHNQEKSIWYKNMRLFFYNKTNLNYLISKICKSILAELT